MPLTDRRLTSTTDRRQNPAPERRARPTADRRRGLDRRWHWTRSLAIAAVAWLTLRLFVVQAFDIPSGSMEGTLMTGDVMFVNKAGFGAEIPFTRFHVPALREPRRGEILVFRSVEGKWDVVKRMVGMPGDTVAMRDGRLIRNGTPVIEPYAVHARPNRSETRRERRLMSKWQAPFYVGGDSAYLPDVQNWGPLVVPAGHYFMLGDNRDDSRDSRYWGFLPRRNVVGTPSLVYFSYDPASARSMPALTAIRWNRIFARPL